MEKFSVKTILIAAGSLIFGVLLLFAVLRWQSGWAADLLFKDIQTKIEEQVKAKEEVIKTLEAEIVTINEQKETLQNKLNKNTKVLNDMKKKRTDVSTDVGKLHKNEIADAFKKMGY